MEERKKKDEKGYKLKARQNHLKSAYNITIEIFEELLEGQNRQCFICGKNHNDCLKGLHIDHDHITGEIRGLLCSKCNGALGWYEKRKDTIEVYLEKDTVY